jgi:hypothetical protein
MACRPGNCSGSIRDKQNLITGGCTCNNSHAGTGKP